MSQFPEIKLGDIATIKSGFAFRSKDFGGCDYPVVKIANIKPPQVDIPSCQKISHVCLSKNQRALNFELQKGDILIAMTGATTGKIGRVPETKLRVFLNQRVGKVFLKNNNIASYDYIYYFLSQQHISYSILQQSDGSAQGNISGQQIENIKIPLPDFITQKAIAHILATLDDKIEINKKLNQTLEDIAKAIFKSWFVDFDPVRAKADGHPTGLPADISDLFPDELVDSEIGEIPKGWEVIPLSQQVDINPRYELKRGKDAYFVEMKCLSESNSSVNKGYLRVFTSGSKFKKYDTLFARITPCLENGKAGLLTNNSATKVCWGSTEFIVLSPKNDQSPMFPYCWARNENLRIAAIASMTGSSGRQRVPNDFFDHYMVAEPPSTLHQFFRRTVDPIMSRIQLSNEETEILEELRDTLLPKLISGELRIPDAERFIATIDDAPSA